MSFIIQPLVITNPQNGPVTIQAASAGPYYPGFPYTWSTTNFDSYVTYTVTTTNGSASAVSGTITYTPSIGGAGGFTLNSRNVSLTITSIPTWIGTLVSAGNSVEGQAITVDSSSNVYVAGASSATGTFNGVVSKYNLSGAIQWQRQIGGAGTEWLYGVAVDSSGNVYAAGYANGPNDILFVKYNSAGVIQFQRTLSGAGDDAAAGLAIDSSNNLYLGGWSSTPGTYELQAAKYSSAGAIAWQVRLGNAAANTFGTGVAVDSSGNVYLSGYSNLSGTNDIYIAKYNTSGTLQWQRRLASAGADFGNAIAVDSSANVYITGSAVTGGATVMVIAKYNTSGVIQWQRTLSSGVGGNEQGFAISVDSASNVYVGGRTNLATQDFQFAKYDSSGVLQWQRKMTTSQTDFTYGCFAGFNFYFVGINQAATDQMAMGSLPNDGSKTGTYTVAGLTFTYAASTLTDAAGTLTDAAGGLTANTSTLTDAVSALAEAAAGLTYTVTAI